MLDIGNGAFALYAHMQPGSVKVARGAKVNRRRPSGKGRQYRQHLGAPPSFPCHGRALAAASNGIPYIINHFSMTAIDKAGTADFDKAELTGSPLTLTPINPPA